MTIEAKRSVLTRLALLALPVVMSGLLVGLAGGCIAQPGEIGPDGEPTALHEDRADGSDSAKTETPAEDEAVGYVTTGTTGVMTGVSAASQMTTGIPTTPDPNEPQPSPWSPNGTGVNAGAQTTSPAGTPQPSPWQGHTPPPSGVTSAQ
jgi:hypothetical protein